MLEGARKARQVRMLGSPTEHTGALEMVAKLGGVQWEALGGRSLYYIVLCYRGFSTTPATSPPSLQAEPECCGKEERPRRRTGGIPGVHYVLIQTLSSLIK